MASYAPLALLWGAKIFDRVLVAHLQIRALGEVLVDTGRKANHHC